MLADALIIESGYLIIVGRDFFVSLPVCYTKNIELKRG
jgi:hypothetical protein